MTHLLMLEADAELHAELSKRLADAGFKVHGFFHAREAMRFLANPPRPAEKVEAAIIDWTLPTTDGLDLLRAVRQDARTRHLPVLLVTGKNDEIDQALSQNLWADDYASKPISIRELVARMRGILRRASFLREETKPARLASFGPVAVDLESHTARLEGGALDLTRREFELLAYFVQNPRRVHSREKILQQVWGLEYLGESRTIDAHVRRVRAKLGESGTLIETVVGVGYRMSAPEQG